MATNFQLLVHHVQLTNMGMHVSLFAESNSIPKPKTCAPPHSLYRDFAGRYLERIKWQRASLDSSTFDKMITLFSVFQVHTDP